MNDLNYDLLTYDQELDLLTRARSGDDLAIAELCRRNQRLVIARAIKYHRSPISGIGPSKIDRDDLVQAGNRGLLRAIAKFDPGKNARLSTYAVRWIDVFIRRYCITQNRPYSVSVRDGEKAAKIAMTRHRLYASRRSEPTSSDIASCTGLPTDEVAHIERMDRVIRLDGPYLDDGLFAEIIPDNDHNVEEIITTRLEADHIIALLKHLSPRDRKAIILRFGLDYLGERTYKEIGQEIGQSINNTRTIISRSLKALRSLART